jgi:hypothetical protein
MKSDFTLDCDQSATEAQIHRLFEQIAQLEEENILLEEVLRRNSLMFEALLSNGHDGIALTGPDRRIVRVIKGLTDADADSLSGVLIDSLAVPEDRQTIVDAYRRLVHGLCGKVTIAVRVPRTDGMILKYSATLTDMLDNPSVQGVVWNYSECR